MKNYKQILEAINRGIKLALDDFGDDEVQNQSSILSKKKIQNYDPKKDMWVFENFVDLGLPSGTLWYKYNLGTSDLTGLGNEYQWAEVIDKSQKDSDNNKYFDYKNLAILKYCGNEDNGDNLTELQLEDDAAYYYDHRLRIPTGEQFEELLKYTEHVNKLHKNPGENIGVEFISKINNKHIFFPIESIGRSTCYWSSSLSTHGNYETTCLYLYPYTDLILVDHMFRKNYFYIKPVLNK